MGFLDEHCLFHELTDEKISASKPFYCGNNDLIPSQNACYIISEGH